MVGRRPAVRRPPTSFGDGGSGGVPKLVVPKHNLDPVWSLRPWPVVIRLGSRDFEVPAMPAADWLQYLLRDQPDLDGMVMDLVPDSEDMLIQGELTMDELYERMLDVIGTVTARQWWIALRLIGVARDAWHILGPLMLQAIDAESVSIAGWLDILLVKTLESMDPKDTTLFTSRLEAPPIEAIASGAAAPLDEMEMDRRAFLSMA